MWVGKLGRLVGVQGVARQPAMGAVRAADLGLATAVAALLPVDTVGCGVGLVGPPRKRPAPRPALACVAAQQLRQAVAFRPHRLCLFALWCCLPCLSCGFHRSLPLPTFKLLRAYCIIICPAGR